MLYKEAKCSLFNNDIRDEEKAEFINDEVVCHSPARDKYTVVIYNTGSIYIIRTVFLKDVQEKIEQGL